MVLLACQQAEARTLDQVPPYLKQEGNFVSYPAIAMGGFGMVVGALIALPATVIATPLGFAAGDPLGYTLLPSSVLATGGAEAGYHIGGAIPYLLKNGFYDAPMNAVARIKGEPASGLVAQVEPTPPPSTDLQYLQTTPSDARVPVVLARQYTTALPPPKPLTSLMLRRQLSPFKPPANTRKPGPTTMAKARPPVVAPAPVTPAPVTAPPVEVAPAPIAVPAYTAPGVEPVQQAAPARVEEKPAPVAIAPAVSLPVREVPPPVVTAPPPVEAAPADTGSVAEEPAGSDERPSLKKKRKFSERFSF